MSQQVRRKALQLQLCFLALTTFCLASPTVYAQQPSHTDVLGIFDSTTSKWSISPASLAELEQLGIKQNTANAFFKAVEEYQEGHAEKLGIALGVDNSGNLTVNSRNDISTNAVVIAPGEMAILLDDMGGQSSRDALTTAFRGELEDVLGGRGAHNANVESIPLRFGRDFQTVDPVETNISKQELDTLSEVTCGTWGTPCSNDSVEINGSAIKESVQVRSLDMPDLVACKTARDKFRQIIEANPETSHSGKEWRSLSGAGTAAKAFDRACLDPANNIDTEVLRNLAVVKVPDSVVPFCGAYRIGPKQFLTAMHCFQKPNGGVDMERLRKAQLFLYNSPTDAITLDPDSLPSIEDRRRFSGVTKEIPARRDFVILTAETVDKAGTLAPAPNIGASIIGEPVVIPGYFYYHEQHATSAGDWTKGIRKTKLLGRDYCRIYDVSLEASSGGCLIHRCQVISGFSGSPVLQRDKKGQLYLIGVHVRGASGLDHHCASPFALAQAAGREDSTTPIVGVSNIAALITQELLLQSGWTGN